MKKLRSISYYARRERLRVLAAQGRSGDKTVLEASNENSLTAEGHQASFVESSPAEVSSARPEVGVG